MSFDPDSMPARIRFLIGKNACGSVLTHINDDDCAILQTEKGLILASTDFINASPIVLELGIGDYRTLGALAAAANIADLYGSGAKPMGLLLSVTMPRDASDTDFMEIVAGANDLCRIYCIEVIGGDTKLGKSLAICGTAIGFADSMETVFVKNRARAGDVLMVSGEIGGCSAAVVGWAMNSSDATWRNWAVEVLSKPVLPASKSIELAKLRLSSAGTDLSDGLGMDVAQMCNVSGVGALIDSWRIPIPAQAKEVMTKMGLPHWSAAFGVGGDFQFVVTCPPDRVQEATQLGFTAIGSIIEELGTYLQLSDGSKRTLPTGGHSDAHNLTFAKEVEFLINEAARCTS